MVDEKLMEVVQLVIAEGRSSARVPCRKATTWRCFSRMCLKEPRPGDVHPNSCPFALTKQCRRRASLVAFAAIISATRFMCDWSLHYCRWYRGLPRLEMESGSRVALPHFFLCKDEDIDDTVSILDQIKVMPLLFFIS